jgi:hypothetical protein
MEKPNDPFLHGSMQKDSVAASLCEASSPVRDAGNIQYVTSLLLSASKERYIHTQDSGREERHRL